MKRWKTINGNSFPHIYSPTKVPSGWQQVRLRCSRPIVHSVDVTYKLQTSFQLPAIQRQLQLQFFISHSASRFFSGEG